MVLTLAIDIVAHATAVDLCFYEPAYVCLVSINSSAGRQGSLHPLTVRFLFCQKILVSGPSCLGRYRQSQIKAARSRFATRVNHTYSITCLLLWMAAKGLGLKQLSPYSSLTCQQGPCNNSWQALPKHGSHVRVLLRAGLLYS